MTKVSFDFDGTLDRLSVQEYAKELVNLGHEVWVCTARVSDKNAPSKEWNKDLWNICDLIGIEKEHVVFCEYDDKYTFFKDKDFIWHLDDDFTELKLINKLTDTIGISVFGNNVWKSKCNKLLN